MDRVERSSKMFVDPTVMASIRINSPRGVCTLGFQSQVCSQGLSKAYCKVANEFFRKHCANQKEKSWARYEYLKGQMNHCLRGEWPNCWKLHPHPHPWR